MPHLGEKGVAHILLLAAAVGFIVFVLISSSASFKDDLFATLFPKPPSFAAQESKSVPGEILIKFKKETKDTDQDNTLKQHGVEVKSKIKNIDVYVGKVPEQARDRVIEALSHNPNVEYVEVNGLAELFLTPNDPDFSKQYNLKNTGQTIWNGSSWVVGKVGADINAVSAWNISTGSPSVVVAVTDTGLDEVTDMKGKIWINRGETSGNGLDDDSNGFIDDVNGWNFSENNNNIADVHGHGTSVSGVIGAASNNNTRIAGVSWQSPIMQLRVCNANGSCTWDGLAAGMVYAANNGAKVINISAGSSGFSQSMQDANNYAWGKGLVIVAAAGNSGPCSNCVTYPGANDNVVAVSATNNNDEITSFSSVGSKVDVASPGQSIPTANGTNATGTSFSSPHVAGLAALIFSASPSLTNQEVVNIITSTAKDLGPSGFDEQFGFGRIDAFAALTKATGGVLPSPTPTPVSTSTPIPTVLPTATPATNGLLITNVSTTTTGTTATIKWTTNVPSTSRVEFGLSSTTLGSTAENTNLATSHTVNVSNLSRNTRYYFKAYSRGVGPETSSSLEQFRTKNK